MEKVRTTDIVIAAATAVTAVAAIVQGCELVSGSKDTAKLANATLSASRAWIDPEQLGLDSSVESGLPLRYHIRVVNSGKEPATEVVWKVNPYGAPYIPEGGSFDESALGKNETCAGLHANPATGIVLYPTAAPTHVIPMVMENAPENLSILEKVRERNQSLIIDGCFVYRTAGAEHFSSFRFFLRDVPGPSVLLDKDGKPIPAWSFNAALSGNDVN